VVETAAAAAVAEMGIAAGAAPICCHACAPAYRPSLDLFPCIRKQHNSVMTDVMLELNYTTIDNSADAASADQLEVQQ
jgi:hypothetical protein